VAVPAADAEHLAAEHLDEPDRRVLGDVAEPVDRRSLALGVHAEVLHRLAHGVDDAETGGLGAAEGAAAAEGLAGDDAGGVLAAQLRVLVHHPAHHLRRGAYIRRRDVGAWADVLPHLVDPAAAQPLLLGDGQRRGVDDDAALAAAEWDVGDRALPRHPRGEGAHGVDRLVRRPADAALGGAAGVAVLHAEAVEHAQGAVVHAHGDAEVELPQGPAEYRADALVEPELIRDLVELPLRHLEWVDP
jgi:hypothetical protein